ncbi:MAG: tripartite tricarboxylate transporter permease [Clostridiales bacterium]|nr:tripartite tricarboxylate transporter permease [Clostridiales bacterium]
MDAILDVFAYFLNARFVLMVFSGAVAGLMVGAIPGLSVSMATALLVSVTYTWAAQDALAMVMGVYVVGVFSGALSAILLNIPGAPSSVVTTLDGYPLARQGRARDALRYATWYSLIGSLFGILMLWVLARPISSFALRFQPMDYFLLALFGLTMVGALTAHSFKRGLISACLGLVVSMVGLDSVLGTPRLTFGIKELAAGIGIVPVLIGLFGFSEVLFVLGGQEGEGEIARMTKSLVKTRDLLKHWLVSLYFSAIGLLVGALPGAGAPVASFLAYGSAKKLIKNPSAPFGEGAAEGIVASESANNACIGGALIPMLTLAIPGDAVTAIMLSVFYVHGLRPGPMFLRQSPQLFHSIIAAGLLSCVFLLLLGLLIAPRIARLITLPRRVLMPLVAALCVVGAFAGNNRLFDVGIMLVFGVLGFIMRRRDYPVAPMTLAIVLGGMMDDHFRRAVSLARPEDNFLLAMFGRPITLALMALIIFVLITKLPWVRQKMKR